MNPDEKDNDTVVLAVRIKADDEKRLNMAELLQPADVDALVEVVKLALHGPQQALQRLLTTDSGVCYPAIIVTWIEGKHLQVLLKQICTIDQAKQLVALGCPAEGPTLAWWREWQPATPQEDGTPQPPDQFAQIAKWHAIERGRRIVPDKFFPAYTADELWAMMPPVGGQGPTYYAGPGRNGGWYCKQTNGVAFDGPTQAQAVAEMLIYLLKRKEEFYLASA